MSDPTNRASEAGQLNITLTGDEKDFIFDWTASTELEVMHSMGDALKKIIAARVAEVEKATIEKCVEAIVKDADRQREGAVELSENWSRDDVVWLQGHVKGLDWAADLLRVMVTHD